MSRSLVPDAVAGYVTSLIAAETDAQRRLRAETARLPMAMMQIGADQGAFLTFLVGAIGAQRAIEIGTFTGYSAIAIARALPKSGQLLCCDVNEQWTAIAQRYWNEAGLDKRIELKLAPALDTLEALIGKGKEGSFDFAFIDADKTGYDAYYEACLKLLRPGGVIALDNMLWGGAVTDLKINDKDTVAIRALNEKIANDARVDASLVTIGDGVMLARKK
ncbi:SAM-dependent methyltransferase [Parvibaculum sedimenti]|uniref:SAM-dependent methyltransferase n=1 Tax=Parvibaculum sedimenti TaxID=2608632 RepID=A0A6N6VPU4_9HYPH|nr:class I SAM-dependent methyltransferase [Parvibaculum sedimenti]KAB7742207.1 SAM-dependent methyltransferase [Parvibaculum sedimenti]